MNRSGVWRYRFARHLGRLVTWTTACLTLGRMPPFVSASALVLNGDNILVVVDPIRGEPVLPGGHLRWRENPQSGVIREVREETGYCIEPGRLVGAFAGAEWLNEFGNIRLVYEARLAGGSIASSGEGEARWMLLRELAGGDTRDGLIVREWLRCREGGGDAV